MAERVTHHIMPGENGRWNIEQENTGKVFGSHRSRTNAILQGRDLARMHEYSLLVVHDRAGQVERQYNYGRPPLKNPQAKTEEPSNSNRISDA